MYAYLYMCFCLCACVCVLHVCFLVLNENTATQCFYVSRTCTFKDKETPVIVLRFSILLYSVEMLYAYLPYEKSLHVPLNRSIL